MTPLRNLQMHGAFIAAFTSKNNGWQSKKFIPQLAIDIEFFIAQLSIQNQRRSRSCVRLTGHLAIESLM